MRFSVGYATDVGRKRAQNQDSFAAVPELGLFIVADGMGGHRGGETASAMVADVVPAKMKAAAGNTKQDPHDALAESIKSANAAIHKRAAQDPSLQGMGTTTTALLFRNESLIIGHVGDSRCYFFRPSSIWQITRDHSLVQEKLRAGLITREQAKTDRMKNVITRSVGYEPGVEVDLYDMPVLPGDVFLLCSDGLSGMVEDGQILETVQKCVIDGNDPKRAVDELVDMANRNGGDDNVTVVIIKVLGSNGG
ncbi:MAG: hypothetical protein A2X94_07620 [Bdellovibrionales bacterium GWB1_55_8]|nr:MAG: hypothetical protein A2X94_07620 [Bdellovibrionales bacterium GWB1_55_8]